jgi:hypothetical protein
MKTPIGIPSGWFEPTLCFDRVSELLVDGLNQRMVREVVFSEYAIAELSRKLGIPL